MSGTIFLDTIELSISETDGQALVPVRRTGDLSQSVTIEYGLTGIEATPGSDFVATNGTITLQPGQTTALIPVTVINDGISEPTETVVVSLINVDSGFLEAPRTARVSILDDENPVNDPPQPQLQSDYDVSEVAAVTGLSQPIDLEFAPASLQPGASSGVAYVAEKGGIIKVVDTSSGQTLSEFVDISDQVNNRQDRGLLDIALDPNFPDSPFVYAFYVVDPPESQGLSGNAGPNGGGNRYAHVVRFEADPATNFQTAIAGSETVLVGGAGQSLDDISGLGAVDSTSNFTQLASDIDPATGDYIDDYIKLDSRSHAGGALAFGPDGALYISIGDGTSFNAVDARTESVQDLDSLSGKVLRVDPSTGLGLADNPFVSPGDDLSSNEARVYQLGLRNPFSMSFDDSGRLYVTDTGWNSYEEINSGAPGANFGWPWYEGEDGGVLRQTPGYQNLGPASDFYAAVANGDITVTSPYRGFAHNNNAPGFQFNAITGGDVDYSGNQYPDVFQNDYFFTDFSQGEVFSVDLNDRTELNYLYTTGNGRGPVHFTQGPDGFVYAVDIVSGRIVRLEIEGGPTNNQAPVAADDSSATNPADAAPQINVLANDNDPDGNQGGLSVLAVDGDASAVGNAVTASNGGAFTITANGTATFDPAGAFNGLASGQTATTSVDYIVTDAAGAV
ncbi:MAG: PQQ-dependent sugar dehydrogenase, partial [Pseudomonadota bacterium]